jgi:hypothetical protein
MNIDKNIRTIIEPHQQPRWKVYQMGDQAIMETDGFCVKVIEGFIRVEFVEGKEKM